MYLVFVKANKVHFVFVGSIRLELQTQELNILVHK